MAQEKKTLVTKLIERCQNHPKMAVAIVACTAIIGLGGVFDGFSKIANVFSKKSEPQSPSAANNPSLQTRGDNSPAINVGGTGNTVSISYAVPPAVNREYQETMQDKKKEVGFELIQSRPMAVPFVSFGTGLPKETGGVIENEFKDFWAPRVWMGLGCPTGLSEAGQIGLLRCAQEATAATGCPIDFQQAAQFQSVPQG